jgi:hypothetical protein
VGLKFLRRYSVGLFTSIIKPNGVEIQIKTGFDSCDTYKLGDTVDYLINKDLFMYGGIFDGVYDSTSSNGGRDDWVIIKGHKIIALRNKRYLYPTLVRQYKIKQPSSLLWTKKAREEHKEQQRLLNIEERKFEASIKHLSPREKLIACFVRPFKDMMSREGFARRVFKVERL